MKNNYVNVTFGNSKLGSAIASINLPPVITCREDAPCYKRCYARKGHWCYKNVQNSLNKNLSAYKGNPKLYFESIMAQTALSMYVRWHSSGDIVDARYLAGMCKVARKNKGTKFLCFTKKYEIVNEYIEGRHKIPSNLHIVFSCWYNWTPENPHNLPMAYIYNKRRDDNNVPDNAIPCTGFCPDCMACWGLRKGQNVYFNEH